MRRSIPIAIALVAALTTVRAEAGDAEEAEKLFNDGIALLEKKKYAEACPKLEASRKLASGLGVTMYYADCLEKTGHAASAYALFHEAESMARTRKDAREKIAHDRAAALETAVPRLIVRVASPTPGFVVTVDGHALEPKEWALSFVDAGTHVIAATAPDKKAWEKTITSVDKGAVAIAIPALEDVAAPAPVVVAPPVVESKPEPKPVEPVHEEPAPVTSERRGGTQRTLGLVGGGVGVIAIAVGVGFGFSAKAKQDASNDGHCHSDNHCDPEGLSLRSDGLTAATFATIFTVAGAVIGVGGAVLFFTAPSGGARASIAPSITTSGGGATVGGVF